MQERSDQALRFFAHHEDHDGSMFVSLPHGHSVKKGEVIQLWNDDGAEVDAMVLNFTAWGAYVTW